jgi:hypothetical protein
MRSTLFLALALAAGCAADPADTHVQSGLDDTEDPTQEFELTFTEEGAAARTVSWAPDGTTHTRLVAADQCNSITCDHPTFYIEGNLLDGPSGSASVLDPRIHVGIETSFPPADESLCSDGSARMYVRFRAFDVYTSGNDHGSPGTFCLVAYTLADVGEVIEGEFSGDLLYEPDTEGDVAPSTATFPFSGRFRIVRDAEGPNGG